MARGARRFLAILVTDGHGADAGLDAATAAARGVVGAAGAVLELTALGIGAAFPTALAMRIRTALHGGGPSMPPLTVVDGARRCGCRCRWRAPPRGGPPPTTCLRGWCTCCPAHPDGTPGARRPRQRRRRHRRAAARGRHTLAALRGELRRLADGHSLTGLSCGAMAQPLSIGTMEVKHHAAAAAWKGLVDADAYGERRDGFLALLSDPAVARGGGDRRRRQGGGRPAQRS